VRASQAWTIRGCPLDWCTDSKRPGKQVLEFIADSITVRDRPFCPHTGTWTEVS
jgi:hypothetical protein